MNYSKLEEIKNKIVETGIFHQDHVYLGGNFSTGKKVMPLCIVKSGSGTIDFRENFTTVHIIALFYDASNIEQTVLNNLRTIIRELRELENVEPFEWTTDEDVLEPYGLVFNPVPPFGGFRIDLRIYEII